MDIINPFMPASFVGRGRDILRNREVRRHPPASRRQDTFGSKAAICECALMRTTVELPDDLFRQVEAHAALQGRSLKDLIADALTLLLQTPKGAKSPASGRRTRFPIILPKDPARRLTPEMVAAAEEQLLTGEAVAHGRLARH
jgi:hypothetical protein